VLELLEGTREHLADVFPALPPTVAVIMHDNVAAVAFAVPALAPMWVLTAKAGRRYVAGAYARGSLHVLAPRSLEQRASAVPGSREMLMLTPAALYAALVVAESNPGVAPPFSPGRSWASLRWAWLVAGAAQFFSGQTMYVRAAIARRLREQRTLRFPPAVADAALLGGSVFDLLARERGEEAAVALAVTPPRGDARDEVRRAFGRPATEVEAVWRTHLGRLAEH